MILTDQVSRICKEERDGRVSTKKCAFFFEWRRTTQLLTCNGFSFVGSHLLLFSLVDNSLRILFVLIHSTAPSCMAFPVQECTHLPLCHTHVQVLETSGLLFQTDISTLCGRRLSVAFHEPIRFFRRLSDFVFFQWFVCSGAHFLPIQLGRKRPNLHQCPLPVRLWLVLPDWENVIIPSHTDSSFRKNILLGPQILLALICFMREIAAENRLQSEFLAQSHTTSS